MVVVLLPFFFPFDPSPAFGSFASISCPQRLTARALILIALFWSVLSFDCLA
jgi:hypothetical protein